MIISCPVCNASCVWENEEEIYRHINSATSCKDFSNPKVKAKEQKEMEKV